MIKILCLHGFCQNSELFKETMEPIIKKLEKYDIAFDFFESSEKYENSDDQLKWKQWWSMSKQNKNEDRELVLNHINRLKEKWQSDKYNGILGFCQGAVLVQIFAYQIQNKIIDTYDPEFIILANTFPLVTFKNYYDKKLLYKTLFIIGSRDTLVKMEDIIDITKYFQNGTIIMSTAGHYFSTTSETLYLLKNFIVK